MMPFFLCFLLAYLLGSIPFGLVLVFLSGKGDLRHIGSGNIGATNVLRTGSKPLALLTLILDAGKGTAAVLIASHIDQELSLFAAGGVFLGHLFPLWLKFKGGKGVATTLGIYLGLAWWPVGIGTCLVWLLSAFIFRYSSVAALLAMSVAPFLAWLGHWDDLVIASAGMGFIVWLRHAANIRRLLNHTEPKIGQKKEAADATSQP